MRLNIRFWYLLSILFFVAAVWFWLKGDEETAGRKAGRGSAAARKAGPLPGSKGQAPPGGAKAGTVTGGNQAPGGVAPGAKPSVRGRQGRFSFRVSKTH